MKYQLTINKSVSEQIREMMRFTDCVISLLRDSQVKTGSENKSPGRIKTRQADQTNQTSRGRDEDQGPETR